jgi:hypothetical protein
MGVELTKFATLVKELEITRSTLNQIVGESNLKIGNVMSENFVDNTVTFDTSGETNTNNVIKFPEQEVYKEAV